jgi:hypothetical protein
VQKGDLWYKKASPLLPVRPEVLLMFATTHAQRHVFLRLVVAMLVAVLLFFWSSCARINGG